MNKTTIIIGNTFHCPNCTLIYAEGDIITTKTIDNKIIYECDNCSEVIELEVKNNIAIQK